MSIPYKKTESELDQFVYRVSHDLQEPARGIKSFLMLLEKASHGKLDGSATLYLKKAREQADQLQDMLKDILELSRVGRSQEEKEDIAIAHLIGKLVKRYSSSLAKNHWVNEVAEELTVRASSKEMLQIFSAICDNWAHHSPGAGLAFKSCQTEGYNSILFEHTPVEIPTSARTSMFEMFYTSKRQDGHNGTGLALVKAIVENLGGYVEAKYIESEYFQLYLHFPE